MTSPFLHGFLTDPPLVKTEIDVAFAISANSVNYIQTFRLMKDTIAWIIGEYGTDKLHYSVILFGADASTELNFDADVPTPNLLIQFVQSLSRRSRDPDLTKALEEAQKVFTSAGARPQARKVYTGILFKSKINLLCLTSVRLNSLATDKPVALEFRIELEFRNVGF